MNAFRHGLPALVCLLLAIGLAGQLPAAAPRFTEEREAAVLFFVRKQLPDLLPVLEELKKSNPQRYQLEVGTIFQATEYLAELRDNPARHDLELKVWQTEQRAHLVLARLSLGSEAERKLLETQLRELSRELVDLEIRVLKLKAEQLAKELAETNAALTKSQQNADKQARERFDKLLEKVKKASN